MVVVRVRVGTPTGSSRSRLVHIVGIGCLGGSVRVVSGARLVSAESNLGHAVVR